MRAVPKSTPSSGKRHNASTATNLYRLNKVGRPQRHAARACSAYPGALYPDTGWPVHVLVLANRAATVSSDIYRFRDLLFQVWRLGRLYWAPSSKLSRGMSVQIPLSGPSDGHDSLRGAQRCNASQPGGASHLGYALSGSLNLRALPPAFSLSEIPPTRHHSLEEPTAYVLACACRQAAA